MYPWMVLFVICASVATTKNITVLRIGGLFHNENEEIALRAAAKLLNSKYEMRPFRLEPDTMPVYHYNTYDVVRKACELLQNGPVAIFGPNSLHSSAYAQKLFDRKEIPHIETHWDPEMWRGNCLLNLHPHPATLAQVYVDLVLRMGWERLTILYESNESLLNIGSVLFDHEHSEMHVTLKLLANDDSNYRATLMEARASGEKNFIVDCSIDILEPVLRQAQQIGLITESYNFIITTLDLHTIDLTHYQYAGANITAVRLIDPEHAEVINVSKMIKKMRRERGLSSVKRQMSVHTALVIDAVQLFYEAILDLTSRNRLVFTSLKLDCNKSDNWKYGHTIINYMKGKRIQGLSGPIKFDLEGFRKDFLLDVMQLTPEGLYKTGTWDSIRKLQISKPYTPKTPVTIGRQEDGSLRNKTFTIITCLTTPYGMLKENTDQLIGNDQYEGFGIDLIQELAAMLGFNYTFIIQEDGANGNFNATTQEWDGLIGAITSGRADLAIADLTVTAEREKDVDFTLQFMNLGILILYKKPEPVPPSLFMFASPFSFKVWISLGIAYLLVSLLFFVMGRLSPMEWTNPYPCVEEPKYLVNQFSIRNSLWFTVGSLMQQGSEIAPIGISTRTASGVWWFFTLIMVSTYTANLAAFLTVETLLTPFSNVNELAMQREIKYGAKRGGATWNFFKDYGNDSVRQAIFTYMSLHESQVMTDTNDEGVDRVEKENYAFFMESTTIEYVTERHCSLASVGAPLDDKGYAIAMKKDSPYRNDLSTAILKLQETGRIAGLKEKWWREKRGAGHCGGKDRETEATPLNMQNVGGVFLVLFVGSIFGFLWALLEIAIRIYLKHRKEMFKRHFLEEMRFFVQFQRNVKTVPNDANK